MRSLSLLSLAALAVVTVACGTVESDFTDAGIDAPPVCEPACGANATCTGPTCECDSGYEGDGQTCTDVDECLTNNGGCDVNATCFNTTGSRNCGCNSGYIGDGLSCRQMWRLVGSATIRLSNVVTGQTNNVVATAVGNRIFFAPDLGADGDISNHFMRSYDFVNNTFSASLMVPPAFMSDFCACGYTQIFVSDGTDIYMFGNDGYKYDPSANRWTSVTSYTSTRQRGESAGAYDPTTNRIYMIGGRGDLNTAQYFTPSSQAWGDEPGTLPFGLDSAGAWLPPGTSDIFVAGGYASDNVQTHLLRHTVGTNAWASLPDAPTSLNPTGMGSYMGKLWVSSRSQFFIYDPVATSWRPPLTPPAGFILAVSAGPRTFALVQAGATLEIHELMAIE